MGRVVSVWWARPGAPRRHEAMLTPDERARCSRLAFPADRARFLSAHVLARIAVADRLRSGADEVALGATCLQCGGAHGRPEVRSPAGSALHLSLSHAGERVVVAVALAPVGIDVEPLRATAAPVADVALSPREQEALGRLPFAARSEALTRAWVRKEAVLKAAGVGLAVDPRTVEVTVGAQAPARVRGTRPAERFQLADVGLGAGFVAAVALTGRRPARLVVREVELSQWG